MSAKNKNTRKFVYQQKEKTFGYTVKSCKFEVPGTRDFMSKVEMSNYR